MERKLRPSSRSTDLAGGERFSAASARASIAMARGKGFKRQLLPLALPHPGFKGGTFYLAKKRNFLLCVDNIESDTSTRCNRALSHTGPHPYDVPHVFGMS